MPDQSEILETQTPSERDQVEGQVVEFVPVLRLLRLPKAAPSEAETVIVRYELRGEVVEDVCGAAQTGEEHKRCTVAAPVKVLQASTIYGHKSARGLLEHRAIRRLRPSQFHRDREYGER